MTGSLCRALEGLLSGLRLVRPCAFLAERAAHRLDTSPAEEGSMIRHLEPGRVEGPADGGPDLREERGRVRRREVGLQGRLLLPLLEEQNGVGSSVALQKR